LRVTVGDLVGGIERRQRGLDSQQEEVQAEIANLLQADWFGAVARCQSLLDTTTDTLRELNEVLLRDTHHFVALLQEIQALASDAEQAESDEAVQRVIEHVDRIAAWGGARQRAWSDYYQYVHRYLRDVVRLDPDRALSQRLRDQVASWPSARFHLLVAAAPSIRLLRPLESRVERPPVARPRTDREAPPDLVDPENAGLAIENLVAQALAAGAESLAEVTERVLPKFPPHQHYVMTGRVADVLARVTRMRSTYERSWRPVEPNLELEDWDLPRAGDAR
jgi:chromosome partition protein MukF